MQRHTGLVSEVMVPFDLKSKATVYITRSMDYGADRWILARLDVPIPMIVEGTAAVHNQVKEKRPRRSGLGDNRRWDLWRRGAKIDGWW
jgi:hypothetical protein